MTLRVLLVCGAGMSSSLLVKYTAQAAKELNEDIEVWAVPVSMASEQAGKCDVCLVGPQVRFEIKRIQKVLPGIPVEMIEMRAYGRMDGKAIVKQAKTLVNKD